MADTQTYQKDRHLLEFLLATYLTKLHYTTPKYRYDFWVFWSQDEGSRNNSSSDDPGLIPDPWLIHQKIKYLFSEVKQFSNSRLIQFWAPVTTGGRLLLTTSDQPFALSCILPDLINYRLSSLKYQYNIDAKRVEIEEDPTITSDAPARAFLNHLPEVVLDTGAHQGCLSYFVLPICDPSQNTCVGVVGYTLKDSASCVFQIFNRLNAKLEKVNLSTFLVQERLPYKTIHGLQHAKDEIEEALKNVCETLKLCLAQVWIACEVENHVPFSSSLEDAQMKQMLALKLAGCCVEFVDDEYEFIKDYSDACYVFPLKMEGLVGKTLQNYKSHFCKDTSNLDTIKVSILKYGEYSCFTICLRSINTGDFDYAFEFLWLPHQNHVLLLESVLFTLKRCLPSFKFASGAELGDELRIVDVKDSSKSEISFFKIFEGNMSSPEALEEGRRPVVEECSAYSGVKCKTTPIPLSRADIEQQIKKTMKEAAKNLNVSLSTLKRKCKILGISKWQGPNFKKRKVNVSYKNQIDTNQEDNRATQDPLAVNRETTYLDKNTLTIKATYGDDVIKFDLPISLATFVAVEMEISKTYKLNPATYKLKYLDEDEEWILMISDQNLRDCIKSWRNLNRTAIRLRVLPSTLQM